MGVIVKNHKSFALSASESEYETPGYGSIGEQGHQGAQSNVDVTPNTGGEMRKRIGAAIDSIATTVSVDS